MLRDKRLIEMFLMGTTVEFLNYSPKKWIFFHIHSVEKVWKNFHVFGNLGKIWIFFYILWKCCRPSMEGTTTIK